MNPLARGLSSSSSAAKKAAHFLLVIAALLVISLPLFSQGSTGTIQGGVFDSAGGSIAGAKVTVTDVARGTTRVLTTDESGQFAAPSLTAGTYTVRAEATGFSTVEHSNVLLEVVQTVRVDLTLSPGAQTQTITVTEEVPAINTTSATLGGTITNQTILELPLNGRNFLQLLQLRPGSVCNSSTCGDSSTNGRRQGSDVLLIEGVTQFDLATSNTLINGANKGGSNATVPVDAIQEFSTQQNAPSEYGWRDGSVVNVGIKSGTNGLHGTAYSFYRNAKATDAKSYFTGAGSNLTYEQFGGTVGGPFVKDKAFWFFAFEGVRSKTQSTASITIPSSVPGLGVGSSIPDACAAIKAAAAPNNVVSPLSAQLMGLNIATCTVSTDPAVEHFFPYNDSGSINVNRLTSGSNLPQNNGLAKGDWNLTERNHLTGFYFISRALQTVSGAVSDLFSTHNIGNTQQFSGSWTYTPNSAWVNDFRFGQAITIGDIINGDRGRLPSDPYPTGYGFNTGVTKAEFGGLPCLTIASFSTLGNCGKPGRRGPQGQLNFRDSISYLHGNHALKFGGEVVFVKFNDASLADVSGGVNFTGLTGLTNFLTGTVDTPTAGYVLNGNPDEELRERWFSAFIGDTWRITPRITLTPGVRYEYVGSPHELHNDIGTFDTSVPGGIVQVGPGLPHSRLTSPQKANFSPRVGVAWDIRGNGRTVLRGGISRLSSFPSITAIAQQTPFGASLFGGTAAAPVLVLDRSGLDINKTSVLRLSFDRPQITWSATGPVFPIASASGPVCSVAVPCQTFATDPHFKNPKSLQWNLDIQRAITNRLTLDVAYVGNHGYDETHSIDLNAVPLGVGWNTPWTAAQLAAQTGSASSKYAFTGAGLAANTGKTSSQICIGQGFAADAGKCKTNTFAIVAARPFNTAFPYYNYVVRTTSGFFSNYNALQVTLDGRNFHGVSFLTAYTYGHALDMWSKNSQGSTVPVDPNNERYQYGNGDLDLRHNFRFSPSWQIPGVKTPGQVLEGWSLSGILSIQSGATWSAVDATKNDWAGNGEASNVVPSPNTGVFQTWNFSGPHSAFNSSPSNTLPCYGKLTGCTALSFTVAPTDPALLAVQQACIGAAQAPYTGNATASALALQSLANNGCYIRDGGIMTPPAYGTLGDAGRNSFFGPSSWNVDLSLGKKWHIGERYSAQLRIESYNLFNHPVLGLPSGDPTKGFAGRFGFTNSTASTPRRMQFGLKISF